MDSVFVVLWRCERTQTWELVIDAGAMRCSQQAEEWIRMAGGGRYEVAELKWRG